MDRKKIVGTPFKTADGVNIGYNVNVNFDNSNKPFPTGEVVRVVNAGEQFEKERKDSTKYRLTGDINPMVFYPQEFYWLGNQINSNFEFITGATSTSQTNPLATQNYSLPNILTLNGPNPSTKNFDIDNKDNWVGQILYPYQNEYTLKYRIPQFNSSKAYAADPEDARFSIDTGIDKLIYNKINNYLDLMVDSSTMEDWFIGSNFIVQEPVEYNETLIIANQQFQGYPQDGVPFLFSIPIKTEQGWFTGLYTPFPHNFEEDDYIFIKPIASTGYEVANTQYDTCDPSLYGFKRVIGTQWNSALNNKGGYYVIVEHKSQFHADWDASAAPNSSSWKVVSSQGFIKRIKNYSDVGILEISTEPLINSTISVVPEGTMVTLTVEHNLKKEDDILLTLAEDAVDTTFPGDLRPLLYNLSGIYEVVDIVNLYSFTIRAVELADTIAYYNGEYDFNTLPQSTFITVHKLNPFPSDYYLRRGKILTTINEFEVNILPMSSSIFNDPNANLVIEEDIDIKGLKDNLNRPISQLYLSLTKRAGKENYDFTDVESFFSWIFNFSQILVKTGDGLEVESKRCKDNDDYVGYVKDVTGGWMDAYAEFLGDSYFIDFSEYNKATLEEKRVEELRHRFNTSYRECGDGVCDEYLLDVRDDNFSGWNYYASNTSDLTLGATGVGLGAWLTSTDSWVGPLENNSTTGNFIEKTFVVTADYVNQALYMTFKYTQVTTTGIVKILDPGGGSIVTSFVYPGNTGTMNGVPQQGTYSAVFTPSSIGVHTILLGLGNFPAQIDIGGTMVTTTTFEGKYGELQILKYYGSPQYSGWVYDPFQEYQIRRYSDFIETADPTVLGIPDYATFIDGLWYWRDLLDIGFFEDIDFINGVDYPFLNGKHYVDETKNMSVSITPNQLGGTNGNGIGRVVFGCMDTLAKNYNPFATEPCGADPIQGGPCVPDINAVMQTLVSNPLGCCCFYETDPTIVAAEGFAATTAGPIVTGGQWYDYGTTHSGWNKCNGLYPYWQSGTYYGVSQTEHPLLSWGVSYWFYGVDTGVDTPAARFEVETGTISTDIFTFQNYASTSGTVSAFENLFATELGDGGTPIPSPTYTNLKGQDQVLSDVDSEWHSPNGTQAGGTWKTDMDSAAADNKLTDWLTSENVIDSTTGTLYASTPKYFDQTGILEFYKFDTSTCNTCFDKGSGTVGTNDYFAPRHNWPLLDMDNIGAGGSGILPTFVNGNAVTLPVPKMWQQQAAGTNNGTSMWMPRSKYERGANTPNLGYNAMNPNEWGSAGLIARDIGYGSQITNIAAHRKPDDPDNWRFFYAQCPQTWSCWVTNDFGENGDAHYPGIAPAGTSSGPVPSGLNATDYTPADGLFNDYAFAVCETASATAAANMNTNRYCACTVPTGGSGFGSGCHFNYQVDMEASYMYKEFKFAQGQPSFFEPIIPGGETHSYRFRGRVNIEMGVNHNGFEFYHNTAHSNGGWQFAMNPDAGGATTGGPPLAYLSPWWYPNTIGGNSAQGWLQWSQWVAQQMNGTNAYLDYTRQYAGFWIAVVSETDKVTYIYDPDDGGNGYTSSAASYQSVGPGGGGGTKWNIGCGGKKSDGATDAVNKMSYTPCNDYGGLPSAGNPDVSSQCGIDGIPGADSSNPCDLCSSFWDGTNDQFDNGSGSYDWQYNHPRVDELIRKGMYVPSCGEKDSNSEKADFQKQWSQSFISQEIPLKTGDKVFMFVRTINGEFKTNWKGGTEYVVDVGDATGPIATGYGTVSSMPEYAEHLPSYIVGQLTQIT